MLADYAEEWLWQRPDSPASQAWVTADGRGLWVVVGEWFMQAVDRRPALPTGTCLAELIARHGVDRTALLDCAIDFGRVENEDGGLRVLHSSLPWRECHDLVELDGQHRTWQRLAGPGGRFQDR